MPIEILMPALSPTMTEGKLVKWLVKEGDKVKSGKVIAEIETDKATMEVEAVDEGTVGKILVKEGTEGVAVNQPIALLLEEGEDKKALHDYKPQHADVKPLEKPEAKAALSSPLVGEQASVASRGGAFRESPNTPPRFAPRPADLRSAAPPQGGSGTRVIASPLAKRIAEQEGVMLTALTGTGPHGRIIKLDVEEALSRGGRGGPVRRNPTEFVQIPNTSVRKTIAKRLVESKQTIPHFYLTVECEIDALLQVRQQLNDMAAERTPEGGKPAYKLSVNDLVIKATACALRDMPECNVSWYDDAIVRYNNVDVSVAVATDNGLITPIIKNADQKSLPQISGEMKDLAQRARTTGLRPEEFQGGGFSISNLGMYGVKQFEAIINPPQACILAVGAGEEKVIRRDGAFTAIQVMHCTLSVDHRAVDGALGAQWLQVFKQYLEEPVRMFV